jgi:hypothetical protein
MRTGVFPGSFNPPTTAHLAIAHAALTQHALDRVDLVLSRRPLDKEHVDRPLFEHQVSVLEAVAATRPWLGVVVTEAQLVVDMTDGYDLVVVGADKYAQLHDVGYYRDGAAMAEALDRLPPIAVAPRPPHPAPSDLVLDMHPDHHTTSSTNARAGDHDLLLPEAAAFAERTGAWIDPARYDRWLSR